MGNSGGETCHCSSLRTYHTRKVPCSAVFILNWHRIGEPGRVCDDLPDSQREVHQRSCAYGFMKLLAMRAQSGEMSWAVDIDSLRMQLGATEVSYDHIASLHRKVLAPALAENQ